MNENEQGKEQSKIDRKFLKPYDPKATEDRIYALWEKSGFFNPDNLPERNQKGEPFSIVLPPPNVTGTLHMGHAVMLAIEDIMIRYKRMSGYKTLWIPGTDHAAIATQAKVEKELEKKEKKHRRDLGREEFLKRVEAFAAESHDIIVNQVRKMGASVDWSREAFTLDEKRTLAVRTAFKIMYDLGLIYRGNRIVNWDPKGQTTISDDEIVYEERKGKLYTFKYSKDFPISIATTRPETKVGDVAVAVHPDDKRYKKYVGQEFKADFAGAQLTVKIIADEAVDPEFGTGAVGITPAHSSTDADIASRHGLKSVQVVSELARMMPGTGLVEGMKVAEAREAVIKWLKENSLLEKEEEIMQNIATAERTGGIIEPLPKLQWFVAVNKKFKLEDYKFENLKKLGIIENQESTLKEIMAGAVRSGAVKIIPERFDKTYFHWIDNLRDWCISRQIWYGHRIPVWYRSTSIITGDAPSRPDTVSLRSSKSGDAPLPAGTNANGEVYVGVNSPIGGDWIQDEDTLDTWFSSGLWTFSTLGWPSFAETATEGKPGPENDLANYHPTSVLETGYDILFFWVARMVLMTGCLLGDIPFKTVYLHGLVRDKDGRKMSKSLDNIVDPLDLIEKYGADAVRLSLIVGAGPGNDMKLSEEKVRGYKNFANKLWNVTRFLLSAADWEREDLSKIQILEPDKKYLDEFADMVKEITAEMDEYKFYLVAEKLYHYAWHTLADKIIEESKSILAGTDGKARSSRLLLLYLLYINLIKALHPFMPYVTEEIWASLPFTSKDLLMIEIWPMNFSA